MQNRLSLFLVIIVLSVCYVDIGASSIYILDESKNATCAKEMYQRGDLIVPTFNGQLRGDKPPLHYFFMMSSYHLFGINSFSARFFSATMGLFLLLSMFFFSRKFLGAENAFASVLFGLGALMFMFEFHLAVPDPYLITFLFLGNICLFAGYQDQKTAMLLIGYFFIALAILAKGPIAIALSGLGWVMFLIFTRSNLWKFLVDLKLQWGIPLVLLIVLPWFVAVHIATEGAWTYDFFIGHNLDRFTETKEGHGGFFMASVVLALAVSFPLGLLIPRGIWYALRNSKNPMLVFCACFGLAPVLFFLFSQTILPNYVMPAIPFLLICTASWWTQFMWKKIPAELIIMTLIALALPFAYQVGIGSEDVFFGLESYGYLLWIMALGLLFALFLIRKSKPGLALFSASFGVAATFIMISSIILPALDSQNPVRQSTGFWKENQDEYWYYERINPNFVFYFDNPVPRLEDLSALEEGDFVISRSDFADQLEQQGAVEIFRYRNIFESRHTVIYKREISGR